MLFTGNPRDISGADFDIICVPTPLTSTKELDLSYVKSAAEITGKNMKKGAVVILESTVYPGATEEVVKPILEKASGFVCGIDFKIAYSPERINPGDEVHTLSKITKIVSGMDADTVDMVAELYSKAVAQVYKAKNIRTAEAAKVVENTQRDLNIAFVNELSIIFEKLGLNTRDVLDAAASKWNFHRYSPGLVGGYCIPVVPYFLVNRAKEVGVTSRVIRAGRDLNESMPKYVAELAATALESQGKQVKGAKVLVMGVTYKENVAETREAPVKDLIKELKKYGLNVSVFDPLLPPDIIEKEFSAKAVPSLDGVSGIDCVLLAVGHDIFKKIGLPDLRKITGEKPVLIDVRGFYDGEEARKSGFYYRTL